jgi:hypothetical protein
MPSGHPGNYTTLTDVTPLIKATISSSGIDDYAKVALLRAFEKEHRLLAAVDHIAQRRARSKGPMTAESRN